MEFLVNTGPRSKHEEKFAPKNNKMKTVTVEEAFARINGDFCGAVFGHDHQNYFEK
jgi:hypothetical protein